MTQDPEGLRRLAHDLRNALSGIYACAQLLEMSLGKPGQENDLEVAHEIVEAVKQMEAMIKERIDTL